MQVVQLSKYYSVLVFLLFWFVIDIPIRPYLDKSQKKFVISNTNR